ncbi:MAG: four helix bundle protein [Prevotellaceae bacterium]|jgi:four helix bundle protein|nr:four helix bundle protein [Prevotellaceae bacterium]
MKKESVLREKSYRFAVRVVRLSQFLKNDKKEYILYKQILRSGTAIGALICEAEYAQSTADFINKFNVSLKEANETAYWLSLLKDTDYIDSNLYTSFFQDCDELICILVSTIKTLKAKNS